MQICDFQNLSKRFLNEFNEGASTMKLGRLSQVLVSLTVKLNLRKSYLGLWVSSSKITEIEMVINGSPYSLLTTCEFRSRYFLIKFRLSTQQHEYS